MVAPTLLAPCCSQDGACGVSGRPVVSAQLTTCPSTDRGAGSHRSHSIAASELDASRGNGGAEERASVLEAQGQLSGLVTPHPLPLTLKH